MKITRMLAGGVVAIALAAPAFAAGNVVQVIADNPDLSTMLSAIEAAGLADQLGSTPSLNVFAPTNEAFKAMPPGVFAELSKDPAKLRDLVLYHVVEGMLPEKVEPGALVSLTALNGKALKDVVGDDTMVEGNYRASNGVVHTVDKVMMTRE